MKVREIRFSIRSEYRDGCATSFSEVTRIVFLPEFGYVTLFDLDHETGYFLFSSVFGSWAEFAEAILPDSMKQVRPEELEGRTIITDD